MEHTPPFERALYEFSQTESSISVTCIVPLELSKSDVVVESTSDSLTLRIKGELHPRVRGKLFRAIDEHDVLWVFEKSSSLKEKTFTLNLEKASEAPWPVLITEGVDRFDDIDAHSIYTLGVLSEYDKSTPLFLAAAEMDYIPAQIKLAAIYELGNQGNALIPFPPNQAKALHWHLKAAEGGSPEAAYIVAFVFLHGTHDTQTLEVSKRISKALEWFEKTIIFAKDWIQVSEVRKFFVSAAFTLGLLFLQGEEGLPRDILKSIDYFTVGAEAGHPASIYNLGLILLDNPQEVGKAIGLLKRANSLDSKLALPAVLEGLTSEDLEAVQYLCDGPGSEMKSKDINEIIWMVRNQGAKKILKDKEHEAKRLLKKTKRQKKLFQKAAEKKTIKAVSSSALPWVAGGVALSALAVGSWLFARRLTK